MERVICYTIIYLLLPSFPTMYTMSQINCTIIICQLSVVVFLPRRIMIYSCSLSLQEFSTNLIAFTTASRRRNKFAIVQRRELHSIQQLRPSQRCCFHANPTPFVCILCVKRGRGAFATQQHNTTSIIQMETDRAVSAHIPCFHFLEKEKFISSTRPLIIFY